MDYQTHLFETKEYENGLVGKILTAGILTAGAVSLGFIAKEFCEYFAEDCLPEILAEAKQNFKNLIYSR